MEKLQVAYNKSLKMTNACVYRIQEADFEDIDKIVYQMENYIRSKGAMPLGPLIQFTQVETDGNGEPNITMKFIPQANTFIVNTDPPYTMESVIRCPNCLFCRFTGEENDLHFAYDKLNLLAYEEDIPLTGRSYTVFTAKSEDDFSADVFLEKKTQE